MHTYYFRFSVNGIQTEDTVRANNIIDAEKLVKAKYQPGARFTFYSRKTLD